MNIVRSELLKYRRTFTKKLILSIPLFFVLYSLVIRAVVPTLSNSWAGILVLVFNWWPFLFLPLGMGIFASLVGEQERKAGNYRSLLSRNISPGKLWVGKTAAMGIYSFLSSLVLTGAVFLSGSLGAAGEIPFVQIFLGSFLCWLASLALIPIQLWAAVWKGPLLSIGVGFAGMIAGVLAAPEKIWLAVPWSWATRLMCPVIGVHPNGTILEAGSPLLDASVLGIGILVSVTAFFVLLAITGLWFSRREIK